MHLRLPIPVDTASAAITTLRGLHLPWFHLDRRFGVALPKLPIVFDSPLNQDPLVTRCQQGDRAAFTALFRRHRADVARLVRRMLGPNPDVEDVIQEAFIQVFHSIGDFEGRSKFSTWLHRVTVHSVLMHRRAMRSRPQLVGGSSNHAQAEDEAPDELTMRREGVRAFYAVLDHLTEKKRTVFILHEMEGIDSKEIAKIVDASTMTVRTRLFYARRDIIQLLREDPSLEPLAEIMLGASGEGVLDPDGQPSKEVDQ